MTSVPDTHTDRQGDVSEISPELALVDPDLARRLREREPAPVVQDGGAEPRLRLVPPESPAAAEATPATPRPEPPEVDDDATGRAVEPEPEDVATVSEPEPEPEPEAEADDERVPAAEPFDADLAPAPVVPGPYADVDDLIVRGVDEADIPVVPRPDILPEATSEPQGTPVPTIDDLLESLIVPRTSDVADEAAPAPAAEPIVFERHAFPDPVPAPVIAEPVVREPEAEPTVAVTAPLVVEPDPPVEPAPVAPEPAPIAPPPPPARERAAARTTSAAPPPRRGRRFRSVVLMSAIASVAAVGVLSYLDEASVPDGVLPSSPVADDGTPTTTPLQKAATTPKPKAPSSKKPARTTPATPKPKATGKPARKNGQATTPTANGPNPAVKKPAAKQPAASKPAAKKPAAPAPEPRRFAWAPVAGAVSYHVELFRGDDRILVTDTKQPVLELGPTWRHEGRLMRLENGSYRWYVWSVTTAGRDPQAIVQATLSVP